jgi:hypothetical protein
MKMGTFYNYGIKGHFARNVIKISKIARRSSKVFRMQLQVRLNFL